MSNQRAKLIQWSRLLFEKSMDTLQVNKFSALKEPEAEKKGRNCP
jgi:hypothetical protein